jgi:cellulose synthase/poly-beta-1,6-N-acetylglucosamine synthase-like glycosyltransferase
MPPTSTLFDVVNLEDTSLVPENQSALTYQVPRGDTAAPVRKQSVKSAQNLRKSRRKNKSSSRTPKTSRKNKDSRKVQTKIAQPTTTLKITLLVPCHNEGLMLRKSIGSWLSQSRPADEIIVVDDCSTDDTPTILQEFADRIQVVRTPVRAGNKSRAQEYGLRYVTGDVFITTDGDTLIDSDFIKYTEEVFTSPDVVALSGRVKSLPHNWITACRAIDYIIGHSIDKAAQDCLGYIFVIAGAAGAFRTKIFQRDISFDHDTITEDLDFTYKLHALGHKISYDQRVICYTQDPATMSDYINQLRRWYGGGWQNLAKHFRVPNKTGMAFELTLMYTEGMLFSTLLLILPFVNLIYGVQSLLFCLLITYGFALYGSINDKRFDVLMFAPFYVLLRYLNAWIYLEQFFLQIIMRKRTLTWFQPKRVRL